MSEDLRQSLQAYAISNRRRLLSSDGSSDVSPTRTPEQVASIRDARSARRNRPPISTRSTHDGTVRESRVKILTMIERAGADTPAPSSDKNYWIAPTKSRSPTVNRRASVLGPVLASSRAQEVSLPTAAPANTPSSSRADSRDEIVRHPGMRQQIWLRSESGSIWYQKQKMSNSSDHSSELTMPSPQTLSAPESPFATNEARPAPSPVASLKHKSSNKMVVVKAARRYDSISTTSSKDRSSDRSLKRLAGRPSTATGGILSASAQAFKRLVRRETEMQAPFLSCGDADERTKIDTSTTDGSRKLDKIGMILKRAAEKLREPLQDVEVMVDAIIQPRRTSTHVSKMSAEGIKPDTLSHGLPSSYSIAQMALTFENDKASTKSNSGRVCAGTLPTNTPEENAIYKIKRTASADTEVFFKIDISVRGMTNYLPSEAIRVHTPKPTEDLSKQLGHLTSGTEHSCQNHTQA